MGCMLDVLGVSDETMSGKTVALNSFNSRLKFLYQKIGFHRLLCSVLIKPNFDYAFTTWYPNLTKNLFEVKI